MIKKYSSRICFGPDDTSIGGGDVNLDVPGDGDVSSDVLELFGDITDPIDDKDGDKSEDTPPSENGGEGEEEENNTEDGEGTTVPASDGEPTGKDPETTVVEPDPNPSPEPHTTDSNAEIAALTAQVAALTALVNKSAEPETKPEPAKAKIEVPAIDLNEMFKDTDFDKVMATKEGFLDFLGKAMATAQNQTAEKVLQSIPNVVGGFVQRQAALKDVAKDFYSKYPELKRVKKYVTTVANEVSAENPGWTLDKVLTEAATRAKTTLNIGEEIKQQEKKKASKPALPGSRGTKVKPQPTNKLQAEIDDILTD